MKVAEETTKAMKESKNPAKNKKLILPRALQRLLTICAKLLVNLDTAKEKTTKALPEDLPQINNRRETIGRRLEKALTSPLVPALLRATGCYTLDRDTRGNKVGCVLLQHQRDGADKPIGNWSRSLKDSKRNLATMHKECLAVIWTVRLLRPYIEGNRFTVRIDHDAIKPLPTMSYASGKLADWRLHL